MAEFFAYLPVGGIFVKEKARTIPVQTVPHPAGFPNPPSISAIKSKTIRLYGSPDRQEGIRCKAPRSDD